MPLSIRERLVIGALAACVFTSAAVSISIVRRWPSVIPSRNQSQLEPVTLGQTQTIDLEHAPSLGDPRASINLVEFSDFECPFCAEDAPVVHQLMSEYPTQVRFSFKNYPLSIHKESPLAHEATLAAGAQGKFWQMHDLLFHTQDKLTRADLIAKASQLNLDLPRFTSDLDSHRFRSTVQMDEKEGDRLGVDSTPYFFINGRSISGGAVSLPQLEQLIDTALKDGPRKP